MIKFYKSRAMTMAKSRLLNLLFITLMLFAATTQAEITQVSNDQLKALRDQGVVLIDVRRQDEWKDTGIIEGSHLLTFFDSKGRYDVQAWLAEVERIAPDNAPILLICEVGGRTRSITRFLDGKLKKPGVHNLTRGIRAWIKAGEPTQAWSPETGNKADG